MPSVVLFTGWETPDQLDFAPPQYADPLGVDVAVIPDLDPGFALVSGYRALGEAIARRLETPRGGLFYDTDYGTDVRERLSDSVNSTELSWLQHEIEAEAEKDERVQNAAAELAFDSASSSLTITLKVATAAGPFSFVLGADSLTVELLSTNP